MTKQSVTGFPSSLLFHEAISGEIMVPNTPLGKIRTLGHTAVITFCQGRRVSREPWGPPEMWKHVLHTGITRLHTPLWAPLVRSRLVCDTDTSGRPSMVGIRLETDSTELTVHIASRHGLPGLSIPESGVEYVGLTSDSQVDTAKSLVAQAVQEFFDAVA